MPSGPSAFEVLVTLIAYLKILLAGPMWCFFLFWLSVQFWSFFLLLASFLMTSHKLYFHWKLGLHPEVTHQPTVKYCYSVLNSYQPGADPWGMDIVDSE